MSRWSFLAIPAVVMALGMGAQQPAHRTDARRTPSTRPSVSELLYTAAPVYDIGAALHGAERFPRGAQIMMLRDGHATPLVSSLAASADPSLSFDGKTVLFAGKQNADDPWQIWSMTLDGSAPRRVLNAS